MIVTITLALILWSLNLWNQGIYDDITLFTYVLIYANTVVILFLFFMMNSKLNFEFRLTKKVQADGQVLIVLLSKSDRELAKLYLDQGGEEDKSKALLNKADKGKREENSDNKESKAAVFLHVEEKSDLIDLTSDES